jgi:hypothetical protein
MGEMFVVDLDPIPLADADDEITVPVRPRVEPPRKRRRRAESAPPSFLKLGPIALSLSLCLLHGLAIWWGLGGRAGLTNGWPLWRDDHPLYYHSALVTRSFLNASGTTAGYDPGFMSGYAKSVVFPASSTLPELVVAGFGGKHPALTFKLYVLVSAAAVPWLIGLACVIWRIPPGGTAIVILLDLLYIWTDWPINYVGLGMLPYFLAIPLGLVATGAFARFLTRGGAINWLITATLMSLAFLVHLTVAMVVVPASLLAYVAVARRPGRLSPEVISASGLRWRTTDAVPQRRWSWSSHIAVFLIPAVVLAVNAFWWLPGIWLASTKGQSGFVFAHLEGASGRLLNIVAGREARIEIILMALGVPGLVLLIRRNRAKGVALLGFCAAGLFWGYLAADLRELDFLQPGRHTYAFYSGLALAVGAALDELFRRLRAVSKGVDWFDRWVMAGAVTSALLMFGFPLYGSISSRLWAGEPFLSSRPSQRLLWVVDQVRRHVVPGERLLYEEGGFGIPGIPDPFQGGRFSGLLPHLVPGVEVIGGPYLHASLKSNFTQFGEEKLFGRMNWDKAYFVRYAKLYRPAAILCWSPHARRFCRQHPELIRILEDDGTVLIGRVEGFGGDVIEGAGEVKAVAGRIRVHGMSPGLDGTVVLRYHSVPYLRTNPSVVCEPEYREDDPVPFIRLRPPPGTRDVELELRFPGWR